MNYRCPLQAIDKLSGKWKLVYTASSELTGLLGLNRVPGVEVGDITQTINAYTLSALNTVSIQGFGSRTSVSAKAALEVQSPKRVQVGLLSLFAGVLHCVHSGAVNFAPQSPYTCAQK